MALRIISTLLCEAKKRQNSARVKYWEIIADNLKKAGWSLGYVSAIDSEGRTHLDCGTPVAANS